MPRIDIRPGLVAVPAADIDPELFAVFVRANREHLDRYLPRVAVLDSTDAAREHFVSVAQQVASRELWEWHLEDSGAMCGAVRLNRVEWENRKAAVAYYVGAEFQGRGIATTAVRAILRYAFVDLGFHRIELRCVTENAASVRVAERLGFIREGELRAAELLHGQYANHFVYSMLASEFL